MNTENPLALHIGMTGTLAGRTYQVTARLVMGMEEEGETYYWNEYILDSGDGKTATLVHEETEHGYALKLFTFFEPSVPMTVEQASVVQVGESVDLGDGPVEVTLVDESRVFHVEGKAPDWIERGDVARYFNAERGKRMIVVSWTGREIEYYQGIEIPANVVANAFGIAMAQFKGRTRPAESGGGEGTTDYKWIALIVILLSGLVLFFLIASNMRSHRQQASGYSASVQQAEILPAPSSPSVELKIGGTADVDGKRLKILGHDALEVALQGRNFSCSRYYVADEQGAEYWLMQGLRGTKSEWHLFNKLQATPPLTPFQAALKKAGEDFSIQDFDGKVERLFLDRVMSTEGAVSPTNDGELLSFHFLAQNGPQFVLASWGPSKIEFHGGKNLASKPEVFLPNE